MAYVILVRNPSSGSVFAITDDDVLELYASEAEADKAAMDIPICKAWPYSVVEAP